MNFSDTETKVLNRIQRDFPLTVEPFDDMAEEISLDGAEFLAVARELKKAGIVRGISAIFNADRLGYVASLVAFQVDEKKTDGAGAVISSHPGVSHNYLRSHRYNIWFTLAAESWDGLEKSAACLASRAGAEHYLILKNERMFRIGLFLPIGDDDGGTVAPAAQGLRKSDRPVIDMSDGLKEAIRLLQIDLPLERGPFAALINNNNGGMEPEALVEQARLLKDKRVMRRYSAVLRHHMAGFDSNAMTVWKPRKDQDIEQIASIFLSRKIISHLYLRTIYPGRWEYPLFAMIHAKDGFELDGVIRRLSEESGITDYQVLNTVKEFKKERVIYFSPQFTEWEREPGS